MATVVNATLITGALSGTIASTTAGNTLYVAIGSNSGGSGTPSVSGVTLGGSADNFAAQVTQAEGTQSYSLSSVWMDPGCAGGQTALAVSGTSLVAGDSYVLAVEVSGMGASPALDVSSTGPLGAGTNTWTSNATGTPARAGEFAIGVTSHGPYSSTDTLTGPGSPWTNASAFEWSGGASIAGYQVTSSGSTVTYNGGSADYDYYTCVVAVFAGSSTVAGTASLSGSGSMTGAGALAGEASLSGSGDMTTPAGPWLVNALSGSGSLTATGLIPGAGSPHLSGSGTMTAGGSVTRRAPAALSGSGSLAVLSYASMLSGSGSLAISGVTLSYWAALSGTGSFGVPQASGGLVGGTGGVSVPYALPGTSQVAVAAQGSSDWQYLGTIGHVTSLRYSYACPGGCDSMTCTVMVPAAYRTQMFNPGWQVRITRGGHVVWRGKLDEPQASPQGWTVTAVGDGNRGTDYRSVWTGTWPSGQPDEAVNAAIARGLPWANPGIGSPPGIWLGQSVDSGSATITDLLKLLTTRGGLTWYVDSMTGSEYGQSTLSVFPLPTEVTRLLVCTTPVSRTLGGDINTIYIRYESSADSGTSGTAAAYSLTSVQDSASVAAHGELETYIDLSDVGVMSAGAAQAVGSEVLAIYQRASFAGPFTASFGQLLDAGGAAVDPGTDQAGSVVRLILTDFGYGGEVNGSTPVTFVTGAYEWDDFAQVATVTPYQALDQSLSGLLNMENTVLVPIKTASG